MWLGIDVSHWNPPANVRSAIVNGAKYCFAKCSEGSNSGDPQYATNVTIARSLHVNVGHYHKADDALHPANEAANFVNHVRIQPGESIMLDIESMNGNWQQRVAYVVWWLQNVGSRFHCKPFWYCNKDYESNMLAAATPQQLKILNQYPLWIAAPSDPMGHPAITHPWVIHQYGIANNIDRDYWNPAAPNWATFATPVPTPAPVPPKPVPTPVPKPPVTPPPVPPVTPPPVPPVTPPPVPPVTPEPDPGDNSSNTPGEHSGGRIQDL